MTRLNMNKVVLFTVMEYIRKQLHSGNETYRSSDLAVLFARLETYQKTHKFTPQAAKEISELGDTDRFQRVRDVEVDYSIYALELLALWVKLIPKHARPMIYYSDHKILKLKSTLVMDVLKMKSRKAERADEVSEIVNESRLVAKKFLHLLDNEVK